VFPRRIPLETSPSQRGLVEALRALRFAQLAPPAFAVAAAFCRAHASTMGAASAGTPYATAPPLRVGILINSYEQPAWVARELERVLASPHAELVLVVRRGLSEAQEPPTNRRRDARLSRFWRKRRVLLAVLYARLDKVLFPVLCDPLAVVDIAPLVVGCPLIDVVPTETRFSDLFPDEDAAAIDEYRLDVAVRFGFRILRGRALQSPPLPRNDKP
jgi:hypothetical protein